MLFLLYSATVLFCWFLTRKLFLGVLLAVPVDVALYALMRAVMWCRSASQHVANRKTVLGDRFDIFAGGSGWFRSLLFAVSALTLLVNATWSNLLSGLVGAAIGGVATLSAQIISIGNQRKQQKQSEEVMIRGFVQAIADEVTSVWDRYNVEIGPHLKTLPEGQAAIVFPLQQSYFVVFDSNASLIGRIPDRKLREQIIATYVEAKGFVDSMRYYERLVDTYNAQKAQPVQPSSSSAIVASVARDIRNDKIYRPLLEYSEQLKLAHSRLEEKMGELKRLLQAFLDDSSS
jgi:hypothetical protein